MNQNSEIDELNKRIFNVKKLFISNKKFKYKCLKTLDSIAEKISEIQKKLQQLNNQTASQLTDLQKKTLDKKLQLLQAKKSSLNKIVDKFDTFGHMEKNFFKLDSKINSRIVVKEELVQINKKVEINYPREYSKKWFNDNFFKKEEAENGLGVEFYKFYYEIVNNKLIFRLSGGELIGDVDLYNLTEQNYSLSIDDEIDLSSLIQPPYALESNEVQQKTIFNALVNEGYIHLDEYQNPSSQEIQEYKEQIDMIEAEISKAKKDLLPFEKDIKLSGVYIESPEIIKPLDKIIEIQINAEELSFKMQEAQDSYNEFQKEISNSITKVLRSLLLLDINTDNTNNAQYTTSLEDDKIKKKRQLELLKSKLENIKSEFSNLEHNNFKEESEKLESKLTSTQPADPAKINAIEQETEELETKLNAAKKALSTYQKEIKLSAVYCQIPETINLTDKIIKSETKLEDLSSKIQELEKKVNPAKEKIEAKINEMSKKLGRLNLEFTTLVSDDDKKPLQKTIDDLQKQLSLLSDKQNYLDKISGKLKNKSEKLIAQKLKSELDNFYNKLLNNYSINDIDADEKSLSELEPYIAGLEEDLKVWENGIKLVEVSVEYPEKQLYNKLKSNTYVEIRSKHDLRELQKQQKNYFRDEIIDAQTQKAQEHDPRMACSLEGQVISRSVAINSQEIKRSSYIFHGNSLNKKMWIDTSFSKSTNDGEYSIAKVDYFCSRNLTRAEQSECALQYAMQLLLHYDENDPKSTITLAINKEHKDDKNAIEQANRVYAALLYLTSKKYVAEHYINLPKEKLIINIPGLGPKFFDDPFHKNPLKLQENFIKEHTRSHDFGNEVADFMAKYKAFRASNKNETEKDINREYIRQAK